MVVEKVNSKKIISFRSNKELHHVKLDNVIYVFKDNEMDKTIIVTEDGEYPVRDPLSSSWDVKMIIILSQSTFLISFAISKPDLFGNSKSNI